MLILGSLFQKKITESLPNQIQSDTTRTLRMNATSSEPFLPTSSADTDRPQFCSEPSPDQNRGNRISLFPCLHPINPHMRSRKARLQTFLDNASRWPTHRIRATLADIADAGMYYLGERDRVKCWYCNGGLQNWEMDDSPWEEHAKWFPLCEFVLQCKGPQFIHRIVTKHPGLRRPMLYNPSTSSSAREIAVIVNQSQSNNHEFRNESQTSHPVVVDPQDEMRLRRQNVEQTMTSSPLISDARLMGFDDDIIRMAVTRLVVFMQMIFFWLLIISYSKRFSYLIPQKLQSVLFLPVFCFPATKINVIKSTKKLGF